MASTSLTFDLLARDRASDKFDRVGSAAQRAGGHLSGLGSKFKSMAKYAAVATVAAAGFAFKFGIDAVNAASDMTESLSKTGVVFGKSADDMIRWAQTSAEAMGMSKQAALESSGTIGNLLLSMGKTPKVASVMSRQMVQLAADLGSFNNVPVDEVLGAMRSGLTGEIAPLRRFGVNLTDATLKAKAMEMGLYDGKGALDVSAKSSAAYKLILEQTSTAQGDFARTAGGMANQQKILKAKFDDLKANIGKELLPVAVKLMTWMNDSFIPGAQNAADWLGSHLGPAFSAVGGFIQDKVIPALKDVGPFFVKVGDWIKTKLLPALGGVADDVGPGVADVFDAIKGAVKDAQPFLHAMGSFIVDTLIPVLGDLARNVLPLVADHIRFMGKAFGLVGKIFTGVWNNFIQPVLKFIIKGIAATMEGWSVLLRGLSHVPGFGWAKDAADKMHNAAVQTGLFADSINKIPKNPHITITTTYVSRGGPGGQAGGSGSITGGGGMGGAGKATGGGGGRRGKSALDGMEIRVTGIQDPAAKAFIHTGGSSRY